MLKKYLYAGFLVVCVLVSGRADSWALNEHTATWWEGSSVELSLGQTTILVDPFFPFFRKADVILCTREHYAHCHVPTIRNMLEVSGAQAAMIIGPLTCENKFKQFVLPHEMLADHGQIFTHDAITMETVYSYEQGMSIGFVMRDTTSGISVCHLGGTEECHESFSKIKNIDYLFLPMGKMSFDSMILTLRNIRPRYCIPIQYRPWRGNVLFEEYANEGTPANPQAYIAELERLVALHSLETKIRVLYPGEPLVLEKRK